MNKLKQILEFIRALLGFLLNLKKKKTDEKNEKPGCIGALLTLSEYGQTARDKPPPSWDGH